MKNVLCVLLIWLSANCLLNAADISAEYKNGTYHLNATFTVEAGAEAVIDVLTDYENIGQLHPTIIESEVLGRSSENSSRIRTIVKDCAVFFCKKITRVENVKQIGLDSLEAEVVPFLSDLRSGHTKWEFLERSEFTEVKYHATMQPKFWIPPIIRSKMVPKKFKKRIAELVQRLQMIASANQLSE